MSLITEKILASTWIAENISCMESLTFCEQFSCDPSLPKFMIFFSSWKTSSRLLLFWGYFFCLLMVNCINGQNMYENLLKFFFYTGLTPSLLFCYWKNLWQEGAFLSHLPKNYYRIFTFSSSFWARNFWRSWPSDHPSTISVSWRRGCQSQICLSCQRIITPSAGER